MKPVLTFIIGLVGGAAIMFALKPDKSDELATARQEADSASHSLGRTREELAQARTAATTLKKEVETTQAALAATQPPSSPPPAGQPASGKPAEGEGGKKFAEMIKNVGLGQVKTQMEAKLANLKDRLKLSPDQEAKLKELIGTQVESITKAFTAMMDGKMEGADFGKVAGMQKGELPPEFEALLTADQQAEYAKFKQEERSNRIEMRANAELIGLQAAGGLSPDQKDQVFGKLTELATAEEEVDWSKIGGSDEVSTFFEQAINHRLEAMRPILNEAQMKAYEAQIEMQRQMMSNFMPGLKKPEAKK